MYQAAEEPGEHRRHRRTAISSVEKLTGRLLGDPPDRRGIPDRSTVPGEPEDETHDRYELEQASDQEPLHDEGLRGRHIARITVLEVGAVSQPLHGHERQHRRPHRSGGQDKQHAPNRPHARLPRVPPVDLSPDPTPN